MTKLFYISAEGEFSCTQFIEAETKDQAIALWREFVARDYGIDLNRADIDQAGVYELPPMTGAVHVLRWHDDVKRIDQLELKK